MTMPHGNHGKREASRCGVAVFFAVPKKFPHRSAPLQSLCVLPSPFGRRAGDEGLAVRPRPSPNPLPRERAFCRSLSRAFLMTRRALLRSWWRRIEVRPGLHHFIMAGAAIVMKRLLISHDGRFGAAFKFHGRNL